MQNGWLLNECKYFIVFSKKNIVKSHVDKNQMRLTIFNNFAFFNNFEKKKNKNVLDSVQFGEVHHLLLSRT